jgi:hypothetical protein
MSAAASLGAVAVALIDVDGKNLRREKGDVSGLKASLSSLGMLQPLTLRPMPGGRYELVAGHRRFAAAVQGGAKVVPAIIREMDEREKWEARLGENLHRSCRCYENCGAPGATGGRRALNEVEGEAGASPALDGLREGPQEGEPAPCRPGGQKRWPRLVGRVTRWPR